MTSIFTSSVINAPIDDVWAKIRDFNALPDWHPAIADSRIEGDGPSDRVGWWGGPHRRAPSRRWPP